MKSLWIMLICLLAIAGGLWAKGSAEPEQEKVEKQEAAAPAAGKYKESPMLAALVAKGELPPIEERLPKNPSVVEPFEEIGQHGGTLRVFHTDQTPWQEFAEATANGPRYMTMDLEGNIHPDIMTGWSLADDFESITLTLREGIKWSDGEPFTVDDVLFTWNDMHNNENVTMWNSLGPVSEAVALDDSTVRLDFRIPIPQAVESLTMPGGAVWNAAQPKHYLKKWHIAYNPDANKLAQEEGHEEWWQAFYQHYWWNPTKDLVKPVIQPWQMTQSDSITRVYDRNPYYFRVDTEGNQLPYIDKVVASIVDQEVYTLKIISGESDIAYIFTNFDNYTLYMENRDKGGYGVHKIDGIFPSNVAFQFNLLNPDPAKRQLFNTRDFRIALSLAINREEINKVVYFGQGKPLQATTQPFYSWVKPEWGQAYVEYDPETADRMLDEIGLTNRDKDGFRLGPDGEPLLLVIEFASQQEVGGTTKVLELVEEYWKDVGIRIGLRGLERSLLWERGALGEHDIRAGFCEGDGLDFSSFNFNENAIAVHWNAWFEAQEAIETGESTLDDFGGEMPGEEPPQWAKDVSNWFRQRMLIPVSSKEYSDLCQKIYDFHAENIFVIGTVGLVPHLIIAKDYVRNLPPAFPLYRYYPGALSRYCDQIYIKQ